ncbi:putative HD superfamily hydrolase [Sphaerochaeta pleomorpha str. Grapes]|uniref:Putative HD superfamily hydrolase n=1 Tax=Sphaerochaeta pleomorpha (strain ATCC BAA-1885 / DSM 22778 / Grapes) TaxID=158190 RepID=G8QXR2_SPHPG|nr:hydrolase [Sphaerochaeta pleomorpha]AEV30706.1 putative HD superfamily hydrolase [Sphaerochaeta pleomorpha str. Grapes]
MFTREEALSLLRKYNASEALVTHAFCVEATMREFARLQGEDTDYWALVGLLHDVDYGSFPEEHCTKAPELLKEIGADENFIHAVCSHGWGLCSNIEPTLFMEKVLYTIDELTGLVYATALMRPERMQGMSVKSVKKKWASKGFAAGVNRDLITKGADMIDMEIPAIIQITIDAMTGVQSQIGL